MKTSKVVYLGFLLILLLQGCMPDSFTKFKEEPVKKTAGAAAPTEVPTGFNGEDLDFTGITLPTIWGYSATPGVITTQTFITQVGVDLDLNGFKNTSTCDGRPIVTGSFSPLCFRSEEREDHDREIIEGLRVRFYEAGTSPPAGAPPTCFNSAPAGLNLPVGTALDEFDGTIVGTPNAVQSDTTPGPNYGLPYPVWLVMEFTNASLVREVLCTQIKIASYEVPTSTDYRFQQNATLKLVLKDFVGQGSIAAFSAGDPISTVDPDGSGGPLAIATGNVIFVDELKKEIIIERTAGEFFKGSKIDDAPLYLGPEATVDKVVNVFQASGVINVGPVGLPPMIPSPGPYLNPTLGPENGIRFITDFDPLPPSLNFNARTGEFNGTLNSEIIESPIKVYAVNPLWENNGFDFYDVLSGSVNHTTVTGVYNPISQSGQVNSVPQTDLAETTSNFQVINPARDAALTEQMILYLSDVTAFNVGDYVSTAALCNDSTSVGRVIHKKSDNAAPLYNYILVQHLKGCAFKVGDTIDATFPFKSPKATVYNAIENSAVFEVTSATIGGWAAGHVSGDNGAKGIINEIDGTIPVPGSTSYILVKITSPVDIVGDVDTNTDNELDAYFSTASDALPVGGRSDAIGNCERYAGCALTTTINNVFAGSITLDPGAGAAALLISGATISGDPAGQDAFGEVMFNESANARHLSVTSGFFRAGVATSATNPYDVASTVGTNGYTYVPTFYLEKDQYYDLKFHMSSGDVGASYQLDPINLPAGLTLSTTDGSITGTPTQSQQRTVYKLTAANGSGTTTYKFRLQVLDAVELVVAGFSTSAQNSSILLHKTGKGNQLKGCRITKEQILNPASGQNNISCYLDAGEEELHRGQLKLDFKVGDNLCKFVAHKPFSYYRYQPRIIPNTFNTFTHSGFTSCNAAPLGPQGQVPPVATVTTTAAGPVAVGTTPADACKVENGGFDYANLADLSVNIDYGGPNCDNSILNNSTVAWTRNTVFRCWSPSGALDSTQTTFAACVQNYGSCTFCTDNSACDADPGIGTTLCSACNNDRSGCEQAGSDGTFAFTGAHNSCADNIPAVANSSCFFNPGPTGAAIASGQAIAIGDCTSVAPVAQPADTCGGEPGACMVHPLETINNQLVDDVFTPDVLEENGPGDGFAISTVDFGDAKVSYTYRQPDSSDPELLNDPGVGANYIISNNFAGGSCAATAGGYTVNLAAIEAMSNGSGLGNNYMNAGVAGGSPFYEYHCKNPAGDSIASIKLIIREWNADFYVTGGMAELDKVIPANFMNTFANNGFADFEDISAADSCNPGGANFNNAPYAFPTTGFPTNYPAINN